MRPLTVVFPILSAIVLGAVAGENRASALDRSVAAIYGDESRTLLGDGTGVVIALLDSGIDDMHPALAGTDSLGRPRMIAEANLAATESDNFGDDVAGHGTSVASVALSGDEQFLGLAPDARFVNARVLDVDNDFADQSWIQEGVAFALDADADILNLSLNTFMPRSDGNQQLDLMLDWAVDELGVHSVACAGNILGGDGSLTVRSPASAPNAIVVGSAAADFTYVHAYSATAFTSDGRMKPDVVAPGMELTAANVDWETADQADFEEVVGGCSFAAPHVSGLIAQQLEAGRGLGLSVDPRVVKATLLNSATKLSNKYGDSWAQASQSSAGAVHRVSAPLDSHSGAGMVDGRSLAEQYLAAEQGPGPVKSVGWDLAVVAEGQFVEYVLDARTDGALAATLTWNRHVDRVDNGPAGLDASDLFVADPLADLDLQILRDGVLIAESISRVDNVEHLLVEADANARYAIRVVGSGALGAKAEQYALAWRATSVPEPEGFSLALTLAAAVTASDIRRRQQSSGRFHV